MKSDLKGSHVCSSQQPPLSLSAGDPRAVDRREFLWRFGGGPGGITQAQLLRVEGFAGGGIEDFKSGVRFGVTGEWSYKAVGTPTYCYDVQATMMHLLNINHEKLTFRHNGIDRRLTDVREEVLPEILAKA